jgi:hypothetical protein
MADRTGRVEGSLSLSEIESAIQFEEAKSFEMETWKIENAKDNLVEFKRLPIGTFPKEFKLTLASDPAPAGHAAAVGPLPMMVGGQKTDVKAWRKQ